VALAPASVLLLMFYCYSRTAGDELNWNFGTFKLSAMHDNAFFCCADKPSWQQPCISGTRYKCTDQALVTCHLSTLRHVTQTEQLKQNYDPT
jgi:hypothetical protein